MFKIDSRFVACLFALQIVDPGKASTVELTANQVESVQRWADVYEINRAEAVVNYQRLLEADRGVALEAADYFGRKNAFEVAAAALYDVEDESIKGDLIQYVLARKREFSPTAFNAAIRELELMNQIQADDREGEYRMGLENLKGALATAISTWLGIPDPKIPHAPGESAAAYAAFIAQVRPKAETIAVNSPN